MDYQINNFFNPANPLKMHIDINSCFATIEQQANPLLRGRPIAVVAYNSPGGCVLAASIEAKRFGVKTGMHLKDARILCPGILSLMPDPNKYRFIHLGLREILGKYTPNLTPKSIDEFVLDIGSSPPNIKKMSSWEIGNRIKEEIKESLGEWMKVSIGAGPNRFLAKVGAGLKKPDGLEIIDKTNYLKVYETLKLTDLYGINKRLEIRLNMANIFSTLDFYKADIGRLKIAFQSILAEYWFMRLRGWEIDDVDFTRKSFGNSYALPHSEGTLEELIPILQRLTEKTGIRVRKSGFRAKGVAISLTFRERGGFWHKSKKLKREISDTRDIYKEAVKLLRECPRIKPVHVIAVTCFNLTKKDFLQLEIFEDSIKKKNLVDAIDKINTSWGSFVLTLGRSLKLKHEIKDRIAFGAVSEL